jgi:hypothetical protein
LIKKDFFCFPVLTQKAQAGLIRASCSTACKGHAQIAQSVEQWIENPRVPGSIPGLGTIFKSDVVLIGQKPRVTAGFFVYILSISIQSVQPNPAFFLGTSDTPTRMYPSWVLWGVCMALTDTKVKSAKPAEKDYKLYDERGLFVLVKTNGSKYWRLKYMKDGKEKLLALSVYPEISLKDARDLRDNARTQVAKGVIPTKPNALLNPPKVVSIVLLPLHVSGTKNNYQHGHRPLQKNVWLYWKMIYSRRWAIAKLMNLPPRIY